MFTYPTGKVKAKTCPDCGHHELGIEIEGTWIPIRTGDTITVMRQNDDGDRGKKGHSGHPGGSIEKD
jgi:hypothetical protein